MRLGIGAHVGSGTRSVAAWLSKIEGIARLQAHPRPLAAGFGIDHLHGYVKIIRFYHVSHRDLIIGAPFLPSAIEDVEAVSANGHDLTRDDRHASFAPDYAPHGEALG